MAPPLVDVPSILPDSKINEIGFAPQYWCDPSQLDRPRSNPQILSGFSMHFLLLIGCNFHDG